MADTVRPFGTYTLYVERKGRNRPDELFQPCGYADTICLKSVLLRTAETVVYQCFLSAFPSLDSGVQWTAFLFVCFLFVCFCHVNADCVLSKVTFEVRTVFVSTLYRTKKSLGIEDKGEKRNTIAESSLKRIIVIGLNNNKLFKTKIKIQ